YDGTVTILQPLILPLHAGKSAHEFLDELLQQPARTGYEIVRDFWRSQGRWADFEKGWRRSLHDGWVAGTAFSETSVRARAPERIPRPAKENSIEICFRPDPTVWDGRFANNAWLQELPK